MKFSLIEFSVENFKIFKKKVTFSMVSRKKAGKTFVSNDENLLKTSLIYGPNASGKSTLLLALILIRNGIINSTKNGIGSKLPYSPFLLSDDSVGKPTFAEVVFSLGQKMFRYNFSILEHEVVSENLTELLASGSEKHLIKRDHQKIVLGGKLKSSDDVKAKARKEVLFISAAAEWNNELAVAIVGGFDKDVNVISGPESVFYREYTMGMLEKDPSFKEQVVKFMKMADFAIDDIVPSNKAVPEDVRREIGKRMMIDTNALPENVKTVDFKHPKFHRDGGESGSVMINFDGESVGTQRYFDVMGPIVDSLNGGRVLVIDEFDNSLHPELTRFILHLFEKYNPNNAQLIVTTHDTSLLGRKDELTTAQIWFTSKDRFGSAELYSLLEFKESKNSKLRNDTEYQKKYLEGRFGALPFIDSL